MKYEKSEELKEIAEEVLEENEELAEYLDGARIEYMLCDSAKRKGRMKVNADCHKVPEREKALCNVDFIITAYTPNIETMSRNAVKILMLHELMHAGYENGNCKIIPHDLEDFRGIIEKYGVDWANS